MYLPEILHEEKIVELQKNKILFVGDIMLARNVEKLMDAYGPNYPFTKLPQLSSDTYLVGNFEASIPVIHVPTPNLKFSFSVASKYIENLSAYGFSHLGLANNHSYDFGSANFENTVQELSKSSITPFGRPNDFSSTTTIPLIHVGSSTVALIGVYGVNVSVDIEAVKNAIREASRLSDHQVIYIHWGDEYERIHNQAQEKLAHSFIDAGADVIIGHHPHVVQDIERYKNSLIFYSLGNFIFDQYFSEDVQEGLAVEMDLSSATPVYLLLPITSIGSRSAPSYMSSYEKDVFLLELSKNSDTELKDMIQKGFIQTSL